MKRQLTQIAWRRDARRAQRYPEKRTLTLLAQLGQDLTQIQEHPYQFGAHLLEGIGLHNAVLADRDEAAFY